MLKFKAIFELLSAGKISQFRDSLFSNLLIFMSYSSRLRNEFKHSNNFKVKCSNPSEKGFQIYIIFQLCQIFYNMFAFISP
jgi:hypothetical protein